MEFICHCNKLHGIPSKIENLLSDKLLPDYFRSTLTLDNLMQLSHSTSFALNCLKKD